MTLSEQDQRIIDLKAQIGLKVKFPALLECVTSIDNGRTLLIVCYKKAIADRLMATSDLLEEIWISTGCLRVSIWLSNGCIWDAEYEPGKPHTEPDTVELAVDVVEDFPAMVTATISTAIQDAITPALNGLIDEEIERYLGSEELRACVQSRLMLRLNAALTTVTPVLVPGIEPTRKSTAKTTAKTTAKAAEPAAVAANVKARKPREPKAVTAAMPPAGKKTPARRRLA